MPTLLYKILGAEGCVILASDGALYVGWPAMQPRLTSKTSLKQLLMPYLGPVTAAGARTQADHLLLVVAQGSTISIYRLVCCPPPPPPLHGGISLPPAPWWGSGVVNSLGGL